MVKVGDTVTSTFVGRKITGEVVQVYKEGQEKRVLIEDSKGMRYPVSLKQLKHD